MILYVLYVLFQDFYMGQMFADNDAQDILQIVFTGRDMTQDRFNVMLVLFTGMLVLSASVILERQLHNQIRMYDILAGRLKKKNEGWCYRVWGIGIKYTGILLFSKVVVDILFCLFRNGRIGIPYVCMFLQYGLLLLVIYGLMLIAYYHRISSKYVILGFFGMLLLGMFLAQRSEYVSVIGSFILVEDSAECVGIGIIWKMLVLAFLIFWSLRCAKKYENIGNENL